MIVLLNGPINAGKSTTGRLLAAQLPRTAHVEVDALRAFIAAVPLREAIGISLENALCVAANLVRRGFHVVIAYPLGNGDYAYLTEHLAPLNTAIHAVTLGPSLRVALRDRGDWRPSEEERQRIREQYADGGHAPRFGMVIDDSAPTPQATVDAIMRHIGPRA